MQNKKEYLKLYLLQQQKINRLTQMTVLNPESKEKYLSEIEKCRKIRQNIEDDISLMQNDVLKEILFLKYVFGKNLDEVSYLINYSKRHTERLHKKALEEFKSLHFNK